MCRLSGLMLILLFSGFGIAADFSIGQKVFVKPEAKGRVANKAVDITAIPMPATIEDIKGDWLWLRNAWVRKQDILATDQALDYYTEQIRNHPKERFWWCLRGAIWQEKGEYDNAIKDYSEAIRLDPKIAATYNNRGAAWNNKGDVRKRRPGL